MVPGRRRTVALVRRTLVVLALFTGLLTLPGAMAPPAGAAPGVPADRFATTGDFVQFAYEQVLGRQPDPGGLGWVRAELDAGRLDAAGTLDLLASSSEWDGYAGATIRLYRSAFARGADTDGLRYWLSERGRRSFASVAAAFVASPEYAARYGATSDDEFVRRLYLNTLGRQPDPGGLAYWVGRLRAGVPRGDVVVGISESAEHRSRRFVEVTVTGAYAALLDRVPDPGGAESWGAFLARGGTRRALLGQVFASAEARARQPVVPGLATSDLVTGLSIPWGLAFTPDGTLLFTERAGTISARTTDGAVRRLAVGTGLADLFAQGEGGLLDLAVDPGFAANRTFYTCQGRQVGADRDVAVMRWTLDTGYTAATRQAVVLGGIPAGSGRHNGCRLLFPPADPGSLLVATGDAAIGGTPQDLGSLAGKVLRIDPATGQGRPGNPFASSPNANTRRIYNYGHRNLQGLATQPGTGLVYSAEHGSDVDDEVNIVLPGDFGWAPAPGGYVEAGVPMTRAGAVPAVWRSGRPTIAPSGITFLTGCPWGAYRDHLVLGVLAGQQLRLLGISDNALLLGETVLGPLRGTRVRTVVQGPDGALYAATAVGGGADRIVRIAPTGVAC